MVILIIIVVIVGLWFWRGSKDAEKECIEKCNIDNQQSVINSLREIEPNGRATRIFINCVYISFKKNEKISKSIKLETAPPYIIITLGMNNSDYGNQGSISKSFQIDSRQTTIHWDPSSNIKKKFILFENETLEKNPKFWLEKYVSTK